jgi:hypothetical protein
MTLRAAALAAALALSACSAASPSSPKSGDSPRTALERYFPLGDDFVYTYDTIREETGERDTLMLRVERLDASRARVHTSSGVRELVLSDTAIQKEGGGFVLRAPLEPGAAWDGDNGGSTRVDAIDANVTVKAGSFTDCVRTVEEIGGAGRGKITSVFCPNVGIAWMLVEEWAGADHAAKRFELRSYGPPVDLDPPR